MSRIIELSIIEILRVWVKLFLFMAIALFVRDFTREEDLGREEGRYYKFSNIGFLIGPLVGGLLAAKFGYEIVFILAAAITFGGYAYFYHLHVVQEHPAIINLPKTSKHEILRNIKEYFKNIDRAKAFLITILLMLWLGFRNIYVPLYVMEAGYLESVSGIILALGIIPFILLEIKVGDYASKKGIRLPISVGFLIIAASLIIIFFSPFVILNFALLAFLHVGAAFIEPLQEFYLFKHMKKEEENKLFGVYMTADPVAHFLAPVIGAAVLLFLPFKFLFLSIGIVMLAASGYFYVKLKHL